MEKISEIRRKKYRDQIWIKASFTVEAAIIVPCILFTIVGGINIGYEMFEEAKKSTEIHEELQELDPVEIVRKKTVIQEVFD